MIDNFTPGPWVAEWDRKCGRWDIRIAEGELEWAVVGDTAASGQNAYLAIPGTAEANARLMAAAPELLDALRRFVAVAEIHDWGSDGTERSDVVNEARAAIAKADGSNE